jgi:hypothetical protein
MSTNPSVHTFLLELILIVVAVLLALSLDQWRADRESRQRAETARQAIADELWSNREAVRAALDYHGTKLSALYRYAHPDSAGRSPDARFFDRGFVSPAQLLSTAWETARETGALESLDYDQLLGISKVYAQQRRYEQQTLSVSDIIYRELFEHGPQGIVSRPLNHATLRGTFAWRERALLEVYKTVLPELGIDIPDSADVPTSGRR